MPIENIKIIRDGEIIQTSGIDGLLLEKVGIYEYLNLTKKIYEGKSLTIQIKDMDKFGLYLIKMIIQILIRQLS